MRTWSQCLALALVSLVTALPVLGVESVQYIGLQGPKANLRIDRRTHLVGVGDTAEGIQVLLATRKEAVLRIDGRSYVFARGSSKGRLLSDRLEIPRQSNGMFYARGAINGKPVDFIVDTGAFAVVINSAEARRLRISYTGGKRIQISTASRVETAYEVTFSSIAVGGIVKNDVRGVVTKSRMPSTPLLGMTFLGRLKIEQDSQRMVLSE